MFKKKTVEIDHMAVLVREYQESLPPLDLVDLFEISERFCDKGLEAHFETLVAEELQRLPKHVANMSADEYATASERLSAELPASLKELYIEVNDSEGSRAAARADVAFRVGVEIGRVLAGGAR